MRHASLRANVDVCQSPALRGRGPATGLANARRAPSATMRRVSAWTTATRTGPGCRAIAAAATGGGPPPRCAPTVPTRPAAPPGSRPGGSAGSAAGGRPGAGAGARAAGGAGGGAGGRVRPGVPP